MLCSWLICASCFSVSLMSCTVETLLLLLFSIHYSMRHLLWLSQGSFLNSWISALFTSLILCDCFFLSRLWHWIRFPASRWPSSLTLVLPCMQPDQVWKLESWVCRLLAGGPAVSAKLWSPLLEYKSGIWWEALNRVSVNQWSGNPENILASHPVTPGADSSTPHDPDQE